VQAAVTIPSHPDVALAGHGAEDFIEVEVRAGAVALLSLVGEHDIGSQTRLSEALEYATGSCKAVIVDLTPCTFAEMTVLGALIDCERRSRAQG
jgi:hypothetical protein